MAASKRTTVLAALLVAGTLSRTYGQCCTGTRWTGCQNNCNCGGDVCTGNEHHWDGPGGGFCGYAWEDHYECATNCGCPTCDARGLYRQNGRYQTDSGSLYADPTCSSYNYCLPPDNYNTPGTYSPGSDANHFDGNAYTPAVDPSVSITESDLRYQTGTFAVTLACKAGYSILSGTPIATECTSHLGIYSHQSCIQDCTSPTAVQSDASVTRTVTSLSSFAALFDVTLVCAASHTILDDPSNPQQSTQGSGTSPNIGGTPVATYCSNPNTDYTYQSCTPDCTAPANDATVVITQTSLSSFGSLFGVTLQCAPSHTILDDPSNSQQSQQGQGTSPNIGGTPVATVCSGGGVGTSWSTSSDATAYTHQSCMPDCTSVSTDNTVVITETSLSSFDTLFNVPVVCVSGSDGAPNPTVCPNPGTPWTYNQCWVDCTSPDGSTNNVAGGAYQPIGDSTVIITEKRISHSSSSNGLPEYTLAGDRLFDVEVTCVAGYEGTPKATACTTEGTAYTYDDVCRLAVPVKIIWPPPPGVPTPPPPASTPATEAPTFWPPPPSPVTTAAPPSTVVQMTISVTLPAGTTFIAPGTYATIGNAASIAVGSIITMTDVGSSGSTFTSKITAIAEDGTITFADPMPATFGSGVIIGISAPFHIKAAVASSPVVATKKVAATMQPIKPTVSTDVALPVLAASAPPVALVSAPAPAVPAAELAAKAAEVIVKGEAESNAKAKIVSAAVAAKVGKGKGKGKGKEGKDPKTSKAKKAKKSTKSPKTPKSKKGKAKKGPKRERKASNLKSGSSIQGYKNDRLKVLGIVALLAAFVAGAASLIFKRKKSNRQNSNASVVGVDATIGHRSIVNIEDISLPTQVDAINHLSPRRRNVPMTPNTPKSFAYL